MSVTYGVLCPQSHSHLNVHHGVSVRVWLFMGNVYHLTLLGYTVGPLVAVILGLVSVTLAVIVYMYVTRRRPKNRYTHQNTHTKMLTLVMILLRYSVP